MYLLLEKFHFAFSRLASFVFQKKLCLKSSLILVKHAILVGTVIYIVLLVHKEIYAFILNSENLYPSSLLVREKKKGETAPVGKHQLYLSLPQKHLLDMSLLENLYQQAVRENPQIKSINYVEKEFPARIRLSLAYREPFALVQKDRGFYVIDEEGVLLSERSNQLPASAPRKLITVTGILGNAPRIGEKWSGVDIKASLDMLRVVYTHNLFDKVHVSTVDVSNLGGRLSKTKSEANLITDGGTVIQWGRCSSNPSTQELSTREKMINLQKILTVYPELKGVQVAKLYLKDSPLVSPKDNLLGRTDRAHNLRR